MIAALKRERAGYVARGLEDRVAEVDKQLKHYGYEPAAATDDQGAPKGRMTPEAAKQTAAKPETAKPAAPAKPSPQTAAQKRAGGKD
jgi:hypothetical protein